jgi:hypothetical protein
VAEQKVGVSKKINKSKIKKMNFFKKNWFFLLLAAF